MRATVLASEQQNRSAAHSSACCASHQTSAPPVAAHALRARKSRHRARLHPAALSAARAASASAGPGGTLKKWPPADVWADFAAFHKGEWDSTAARYAADGALLSLPEKYIPEAYREWGQTMQEWQGRVTAEPTEDVTVAQTLQRWWPTVGCEFGKRDLAENDSHVLFASSGACRGVAADGSYCDAPDALPASTTLATPLRIEHCMPGPDAPGTRIRLVYSLFRDTLDTEAWVLSTVELFHERHATRSTAGHDTTDGFATQSRLAPEALRDGFWEASGGATLQVVGGNAAGEPRRVVPAPWWSIDPKPQWSIAPRGAGLPPGSARLLLLPLNCWAYVEQAAVHMLVVESGQLAPSGTSRHVVACAYMHGQLDNVVIGQDAALSKEQALDKGYIQSTDPSDQAFYEELLEELQLNTPGDQRIRQEQRGAREGTAIDKPQRPPSRRK